LDRPAAVKYVFNLASAATVEKASIRIDCPHDVLKSGPVDTEISIA